MNVSEQTKRDRIIKAAIKVFSQSGFDHASTVQIAKEAGISKGLIFHYFNNKTELFLEVYAETIAILLDKIYAKIDYTQRDLLNRLKVTAFLKLHLMKSYPEIFEFLKTAYFETANEVKGKIERLNHELLAENIGRTFENIDYSLFRDDIDVQTAISIITFTLEKWSETYVRQTLHGDLSLITYEDTLKSLNPYFDLFRVSFYKEGV